MELSLLVFLVVFSVFSVEQCFLQAEKLSWNRFITRVHLGYRVPKGTIIIYFVDDVTVDSGGR